MDLEIHIAAVLVAAVAGPLAFEAVVALDTGKGHVGRHDLVLDAPVHVGADPFVLAAVFHAGGLHAVGKGLLPVAVFPVGGFVLLVAGEQVGHQQVLVLGIHGLDPAMILNGAILELGSLMEPTGSVILILFARSSWSPSSTRLVKPPYQR
jgi:hypothetical protein